MLTHKKAMMSCHSVDISLNYFPGSNKKDKSEVISTSYEKGSRVKIRIKADNGFSSEVPAW